MLPYQAADLAAIDRPTLVLHGNRDPFYPIEIATALYRAIPQAELAVVPGAGHNPMRERPDLFVQLLMDFHRRRAAGDEE